MGMIVAKKVNQRKKSPIVVDSYLKDKQQEAVDFYAASRKREKEKKAFLKQFGWDEPFDLSKILAGGKAKG